MLNNPRWGRTWRALSFAKRAGNRWQRSWSTGRERSAASATSWRVGRDCVAKRSVILRSEPLSRLVAVLGLCAASILRNNATPKGRSYETQRADSRSGLMPLQHPILGQNVSCVASGVSLRLVWRRHGMVLDQIILKS